MCKVYDFLKPEDDLDKVRRRIEMLKVELAHNRIPPVVLHDTKMNAPSITTQRKSAFSSDDQLRQRLNHRVKIISWKLISPENKDV